MRKFTYYVLVFTSYLRLIAKIILAIFMWLECHKVYTKNVKLNQMYKELNTEFESNISHIDVSEIMAYTVPWCIVATLDVVYSQLLTNLRFWLK